VASNVMVFLARGNVALSVTMTACSTLMAPVMTPLAMKLLAGRFIEINFWEMMLSIINLVIIPVGGGLIANKILEQKRSMGDFVKLIVPMALLIAGGVAAVNAGGRVLAGQAATDGLLEQALWLGGVVLAAGYLFNGWLAGHRDVFDKYLPVVSMAAICFILAIIASGSREELISIGALLLVAALIHNLAGYLLGYLLAGLAGLSESDRRTVAFEVGMQNGGMGVGLALDVLKSSAAALAPALLGTWMNITGSTLASYWRDRPPRDLEPAAQASG
jgi:BASS family bile acid:Na+ symporter